MNFAKKHVVLSILILIILLSLLFILGETAVKEVAQYIPPASTQAAAVADFDSSLVGQYADVNEVVNAGSADSLDDIQNQGGGGLTVAAWMRTSATGGIIATKGPNVSFSGGWVFQIFPGNRLYFSKDGATDLIVRTPSNTFTPSEWQHVAVVWNGGTSATEVTFYVNGQAKNHDTNIDGVTYVSDANLNLGIGGQPNSTSVFVGDLEDVRIYKKPLTASEVQELFATRTVTPPVTPTPDPVIPPTTPVTPPANPSTPTTPTPDPTLPASGSTVSAASCSDTDVQTAINAVSDQGVVLVPAGTCTWTKTVSIKGKSMVLKGKDGCTLDSAGRPTSCATTIVENLSANGSSLGIEVQSGKMVRVTGFTFDGSKTRDNYASVSVSGPPGQPSFRIDHNKFVNVTERGIIVNGAYGLIDHNTLIRIPAGFNPTLISVFGDNGGPNDSWERPQDLGTANAVFMEDNTFIHNIQANGAFDMYVGARYVFRNNTVHSNGLGHHGFDSSVRGVVNFEIYNNTFTNASPTGELYVHGIVFEFRSGSGVVFNNTVIRPPNATGHLGKYDGFALLRNYRSGDGYITRYGGPFPWNGVSPGNGACDGTIYFITSVWSRGFNYKVGDVVAINQSGASGATATVTSVDANGRITGITPTTLGTGYRPNSSVTTTRVTGNGSGALLSISMDGNTPGMKGYPCQDQIGRTSGTGPDGKQTHSPVYAWNNNFQGVVGGHLYVGGYAPPPPGGFERVYEHIVEGRDYFNGVPRPGYAPYTYPHPLQLSGFTSDAGGPIITVPVGNAAPPTPQAQAPTCTSFTYSGWGTCANGTQTRIITAATPSSCTGGSPEILVRSCTVTPQATSTVIVNPPVNRLPETTIPPANTPLDVIPRTVVPDNIPTQNFVQRFIPSFTSTTNNPTTPSITKPRTSSPFVPLPELTPEETVTTTKLSFTEQVRSIISYIFQRIQNGFLRIFGR